MSALVFVADEGYLIHDGRELYFRGGPHGMPIKLFRHLLKHKAEWQECEQIVPVLWPAGSPPSAHGCIRVHAYHVASLLAGTSANLEGRQWYGYRLMGEVEVI